jgi:GNAT superfamily N-acetyltransferase
MFWRRTRKEWQAGKGPSNRRALKRLVDKGTEPGVLAFVGNRAIGWCAVAPREDYPSLSRSRIFKPVDDEPVWSISCLFVDKEFRRQGLSRRLIRAACNLARRNGAKIVEAYPHDLSKKDLPDPFVWNGLLPAYERAGFREVARRSANRPVVRKEWKP